jgi:hypothetical protein
MTKILVSLRSFSIQKISGKGGKLNFLRILILLRMMPMDPNIFKLFPIQLSRLYQRDRALL